MPHGRTLLPARAYQGFAVLVPIGIGFVALLVGLQLSHHVAHIYAQGPISHHMIQHIVLMNAVAPAIALSIRRLGRPRTSAPDTGMKMLAATAVLQMVLLWFWHAPPLLVAASQQPAVHILMQASLAASACLFWWAVLASRGAGNWRAIIALLLTGKLFCFLGVLLVFAPRNLYAPALGSSLEDQQAAGLLMLAACPITYITAAIVIASGWLRTLSRTTAASAPRLHPSPGAMP